MRRLLIVCTVAATLVLGSALGAYAQWLGAGTGGAALQATSVTTPAAPSVVQGVLGTTISWSAVSLGNGQAATGYVVRRYTTATGGTPTTVCTTGGALTCSETGLPGTRYYTVTATFAGWSAESARTSFTLDLTAPNVTTTTTPAAGSSGWVTASSTTVQVSASDAGSGVASVTYRIGSGSPVTVNAASTSFVVSSPGTTVYTYWATDAVGNVAATQSGTVRLDGVAPTSTITPASSSTWVNAATGSVTIAATDVTSGASRIVYSVDGGSPVTVNAASTSVTLGQGDHTVTYQAIDVAGNTETARTATLRVDNVAPVVASVTPTGGSYSNNNNGQSSWSRVCSTGRVCASVSDATSGVASVTYNLRTGSTCWNGSAFVAGSACTAPMSLDGAEYAGVAIPRTTMPDGTYTLTVTATDAAGNTVTSTVSTFTIT